MHGNSRTRELDRNNDNFLDAPTGDGFAILNRWKYNSGKHIMGQAGIKYAQLNNKSGQLSNLEQPNLWRAKNEIRDLQS